MFKSHNKVHNVRVQYGSMPVRLAACSAAHATNRARGGEKARVRFYRREGKRKIMKLQDASRWILIRYVYLEKEA